MSREEFIKQLEYLLQDIPQSELVEAVQYYKDYFEDAGVENEGAVIEELESPEKVAAIIREGLIEDGKESDEHIQYTEKGYENAHFTEHNNMPDKIGAEGSTNSNNAGTQSNQSYGAGKQQSGYRESPPLMRSAESYEEKTSYRGGTNKVLLALLIIILAVPVGIPLLAIIFAFGIVFVMVPVILAIVPVILTLVFGGVGIGLFAIGVVQIFSYPAFGFAFCGVGLILIVLGILSLIVTVWYFGKCIPWLVRGFVKVCKFPFSRGGRYA